MVHLSLYRETELSGRYSPCLAGRSKLGIGVGVDQRHIVVTWRAVAWFMDCLRVGYVVKVKDAVP